MLAQPTDAVRDKVAEPCAEEVDLWWGSYAGRAMVPSFAVCFFLTLLALFASRWLVGGRGWVQLTFTVLASLIWIVQFVRWSRRFFTWNYRLTTRFLYQSRGMKNLVTHRHALEYVSSVSIRRKGLAKLLKIGDIVIWFENSPQSPAVLYAIRDSQRVADSIRDAVKVAKELTNERV